MVVFKHILLEVLKLLVAEGASMIPIDSFLDTLVTVNMSTSRYVTVVNGSETDCTSEFVL